MKLEVIAENGPNTHFDLYVEEEKGSFYSTYHSGHTSLHGIPNISLCLMDMSEISSVDDYETTNILVILTVGFREDGTVFSIIEDVSHIGKCSIYETRGSGQNFKVKEITFTKEDCQIRVTPTTNEQL